MSETEADQRDNREPAGYLEIAFHISLLHIYIFLFYIVVLKALVHFKPANLHPPDLKHFHPPKLKHFIINKKFLGYMTILIYLKLESINTSNMTIVYYSKV